MSRRASTVATECVAMECQPPSSQWKGGSSSAARAGSPTKPRPMLDRVTPSWVPAMERLRLRTAASTALAPLTPAATSSSTRVLRTATRAILGGHEQSVQCDKSRDGEQAQGDPDDGTTIFGSGEHVVPRQEGAKSTTPIVPQRRRTTNANPTQVDVGICRAKAAALILG